MGRHYSEYSQDPKVLRKMSKLAVKIILKKFPEIKTGVSPVLVYQGMSGISLVTGIALELDAKGITPGMLYVRKDEEVSHGQLVENNNILDAGNTRPMIFVDDASVSGRTLCTICTQH